MLHPPKSDILKSQKFLYIAVTAGIVLASDIVDENIVDGKPEWEVVLLCSVTLGRCVTFDDTPTGTGTKRFEIVSR